MASWPVLPRGTPRILADQRRARAALVAERERAAEALAGLKVERASVQARATIAESEVMLLPCAAELLGMGREGDPPLWCWVMIRLPSRCQPRLRLGDQSPSKPHLVRSAYDCCRDDAIEGHSA
jgi:hypothetical protein